ncbi:MAG: hypothetical protein M9894_16095 [Planctomycetes bacterium]|nr:hypothetical protein [Planctomycetota bacterium]
MVKQQKQQQKQQQVEAPRSRSTSIELVAPVLDHGVVEISRIDCRITPRQGRALRLLTAGLEAEGLGVRLGGDVREPVQTPLDAIRWLLDQIADVTEAP